MEKDFETVFDILYNESKFDFADIKNSVQHHCLDFSLIDTHIDDGVVEDDSKDEYVMCALCEVTDLEGDKYDVRFYYGDNTLEIGYCRIERQ